MGNQSAAIRAQESRNGRSQKTPSATPHKTPMNAPVESRWLEIYSPTRTPATRKFNSNDFHIDDSKVLGEGSFAKVMLGTHIPTGKKVAVKVIDKQNIPENMRAYACCEPAILSEFKHPNIVKLLHHDEDNRYIYIYLQFMEGGDLHSYVEQRKWLEEKDAKKIFAQILDAVQYCHNQNICHRDLKLENILVANTGSGKNKRVKAILIDFGFAGFMSKGHKFDDYPGSVCYAAPELISGIPYDGSKVDIYALGVTLYTMLHGCYPYYHENKTKMYNMILNKELEVDGGLTDECADLIARMMNKNAERRVTIKEIKEHPWMRDCYNGPFGFSPIASPAAAKLKATASKLSPAKIKNNLSPAKIKSAVSPAKAKRAMSQKPAHNASSPARKLRFPA